MSQDTSHSKRKAQNQKFPDSFVLEEGAAMGKSRLGLLLLVVLGAFSGTVVADQSRRCSIPLKLRNGVPFVRVMLNGRGPFTFAVDTGTSREAIVSPALVAALDLPLVERTWLLDLPGKSKMAVDVVSVDSIAVSGHSFHSVRAMVHEPLPTLAPYDGVLGFAFFRDTTFTLDFPCRCLRLDDANLTNADDPNVLPFSMPRNVPVVALTIKTRKVPAQIDSAGAGINLPASAVSVAEFAPDTEMLIRAQSQLSTFFLRGGVLKGELGLGGQIFRQPFVEISDQIPVGNLGAASLQDFAITFDQRRQLVRFQARKNSHRLLRSQPAGEKPDRGKDPEKTATLQSGGS